MSMSYAEIYQNKMRYEYNKLYNEGETNGTKNQKNIRLIKNFPVKERKTFQIDNKFKPRRIQSKSVQIIKKYRKTNSKNKTISKQNLENNKKSHKTNRNNKLNKKERNIKENTNKINNKINDIYEINDIEKDKFYKTEINNNPFIMKENDKNKNKCNSGRKKNKNNNNKCITYQINSNEENKVNEFNELNINKSNNNYSIDNYFDIFRMRQSAAKFKDKLNSFRNNYSCKLDINNELYNIFNSKDKNIRHQKIECRSDFTKKKSKTYYKAIKMKENLEKNMKSNNDTYNITKRMYSSCHNFYNKNNNNKKNGNCDKNKKNLAIEMNQHFFDEKDNRPKVLTKFMTQNLTFKKDNKDLNNKTVFKTKSFCSNFYNNENNKTDKKERDFLINTFSSEIYQAKYKRKVDFSKKNLNLIVEDNPKLNILLRKIPSNKENKDKSYDLFNFISQLRKKNDNIKFNPNIKYNSDINLGIFPANEWEPNSKLKFENFK